MKHSQSTYLKWASKLLRQGQTNRKYESYIQPYYSSERKDATLTDYLIVIDGETREQLHEVPLTWGMGDVLEDVLDSLHRNGLVRDGGQMDYEVNKEKAHVS